jgi:hypothetical protein
VSSSGLIYAVIVGAWAAYLVPMWLRRQDELNEARPTERFSTAIRLLSGRAAMERRYAKAHENSDGEGGPPPERDAAARGDRPDDQPGEVVDVRALAVPVKSAPAQPAADSRRARVLARRRRTTTVLFLAFTAGAIAAAVKGLALLWLPLIPGALLTVYIAHLRRQERRRFEVRIDQRRAAEAARHLRERRGQPPQAGPARPGGPPPHAGAAPRPGAPQGPRSAGPQGQGPRPAAPHGQEARSAGPQGQAPQSAAAPRAQGPRPGGPQGAAPHAPAPRAGRTRRTGTPEPGVSRGGTPPAQPRPQAPRPAVGRQPDEDEAARDLAASRAARHAMVEETDHADWVDGLKHRTGDQDTWDPAPVPLPTYVTAPVAPRATEPRHPAPTADPADPDPHHAARRARERGTTPLFDQHADPPRPRAANE